MIPDSDFIFSRALSDVPFVPLAWIDVTSYQDSEVQGRLPLPALLKVAVSPVPGTGLALQFEVLDHTESAAPDQVPLAA